MNDEKELSKYIPAVPFRLPKTKKEWSKFWSKYWKEMDDIAGVVWAAKITAEEKAKELADQIQP
ncbi:MAG: hypothetical protein M3P08_07695 [Thermoproteota archaeon]|nr:hypothetical protein [Thermoproteota archaeon]